MNVYHITHQAVCHTDSRSSRIMYVRRLSNEQTSVRYVTFCVSWSLVPICLQPVSEYGKKAASRRRKSVIVVPNDPGSRNEENATVSLRPPNRIVTAIGGVYDSDADELNLYKAAWIFREGRVKAVHPDQNRHCQDRRMGLHLNWNHARCGVVVLLRLCRRMV